MQTMPIYMLKEAHTLFEVFLAGEGYQANVNMPRLSVQPITPETPSEVLDSWILQDTPLGEVGVYQDAYGISWSGIPRENWFPRPMGGELQQSFESGFLAIRVWLSVWNGEPGDTILFELAFGETGGGPRPASALIELHGNPPGTSQRSTTLTHCLVANDTGASADVPNDQTIKTLVDVTRVRVAGVKYRPRIAVTAKVDLVGHGVYVSTDPL